MVMERLDAAGKLQENQDSARQKAIKLAKSILKEYGVVDPGPKEPAGRRASRGNEIPVPKELDLNAEWQRQANRYVELGYHTELKMTVEQYLQALPKFEPQPEAFKGRLDTPILVETRIDINRQYELSGFTNWLKEAGLNVQNWPGDPKNYKTPESPYTTWANDPAINRNRKVQDVRSTLAEDERGATRFDGIAFYNANPAKLEEIFIDLPGDSVGSDYAPRLGLFGGQPFLYYDWVDIAFPGWGSLVCGREIEN